MRARLNPSTLLLWSNNYYTHYLHVWECVLVEMYLCECAGKINPPLHDFRCIVSWLISGSLVPLALKASCKALTSEKLYLPNSSHNHVTYVCLHLMCHHPLTHLINCQLCARHSQEHPSGCAFDWHFMYYSLDVLQEGLTIAFSADKAELKVFHNELWLLECGRRRIRGCPMQIQPGNCLTVVGKTPSALSQSESLGFYQSGISPSSKVS